MPTESKLSAMQKPLLLEQVESNGVSSIPNWNTLKTWAKLSLVVLLIQTICQLVATFQTSYQLTSPLIPKSLLWEINKQFVFVALISSPSASVKTIPCNYLLDCLSLFPEPHLS